MDSISKLRVEFGNLDLDGIMITNSHNVRYLSGFTGTDSMLVVVEDKKYFINC